VGRRGFADALREGRPKRTGVGRRPNGGRRPVETKRAVGEKENAVRVVLDVREVVAGDKNRPVRGREVDDDVEDTLGDVGV
jgi:hypothetical protein